MQILFIILAICSMKPDCRIYMKDKSMDAEIRKNIDVLMCCAILDILNFSEDDKLVENFFVTYLRQAKKHKVQDYCKKLILPKLQLFFGNVILFPNILSDTKIIKNVDTAIGEIMNTYYRVSKTYSYLTECFQTIAMNFVTHSNISFEQKELFLEKYYERKIMDKNMQFDNERNRKNTLKTDGNDPNKQIMETTEDKLIHETNRPNIIFAKQYDYQVILETMRLADPNNKGQSLGLTSTILDSDQSLDNSSVTSDAIIFVPFHIVLDFTPFFLLSFELVREELVKGKALDEASKDRIYDHLLKCLRQMLDESLSKLSTFKKCELQSLTKSFCVKFSFLVVFDSSDMAFCCFYGLNGFDQKKKDDTRCFLKFLDDILIQEMVVSLNDSVLYREPSIELKDASAMYGSLRIISSAVNIF